MTSNSISQENMDDNNPSENIASNKNSTVVIDHKYDENGINLLNTEEEADVTYIQYINGTNGISTSDDKNFRSKGVTNFYHQKIMKIYLLDQNMIQQNEEYVLIK